MHRLSPALTLQGAVAHCDMPVETGPTLYLPHSQKYAAGLPRLSTGRSSPTYFDEHHVQLPLAKGDAAFFNPALFHGAGTNRSDRRPPDGQPAAGVLGVRPGDGDASTGPRCASALYPVLRRRRRPARTSATATTSSPPAAEGYAFPTNLDRDQPVDGLAPQTQAELVWQALGEGWDAAAFAAGLRAHTDRRGA